MGAGRGEEGGAPGKGTARGKGAAPLQILYTVYSHPSDFKEDCSETCCEDQNSRMVKSQGRDPNSQHIHTQEPQSDASSEAQPTGMEGALYSSLEPASLQSYTSFSACHADF